MAVKQSPLVAIWASPLYRLANERAHRSTVYTATRDPKDRYSLFPNPVVTESLRDRFVNNNYVLLMDGPNCRPRKVPTRVSPDTTDFTPD